jgi:hypothetical protein
LSHIARDVHHHGGSSQVVGKEREDRRAAHECTLMVLEMSRDRTVRSLTSPQNAPRPKHMTARAPSHPIKTHMNTTLISSSRNQISRKQASLNNSTTSVINQYNHRFKPSLTAKRVGIPATPACPAPPTMDATQPPRWRTHPATSVQKLLHATCSRLHYLACISLR